MRVRLVPVVIGALLAIAPPALAGVCDTTPTSPENPTTAPLSVYPTRVAAGREAVADVSAEDVQDGTLAFQAVPATPGGTAPDVTPTGPSGREWTLHTRATGPIAVRATWIQTVTQGTPEPVACPRSAEVTLDVVPGARAAVRTFGSPPGRPAFGGGFVRVISDPGPAADGGALTATTILLHYELGGRLPTRGSPSMRWISTIADARETPSRGPRGGFVRGAFAVVGNARALAVSSTPEQRDARVWIEFLRDGRVTASLRARFVHRVVPLRNRGVAYPTPATIVQRDSGPCPEVARCTRWPARIP